MTIKQIITTLVIAVNCTIVFAQAEKKHTVEAGETLSSVAKKYGVSEEAIKDANPNTKKFFYVGMELTIPESKSENQREEKGGKVLPQMTDSVTYKNDNTGALGDNTVESAGKRGSLIISKEQEMKIITAENDTTHSSGNKTGWDLMFSYSKEGKVFSIMETFDLKDNTYVAYQQHFGDDTGSVYLSYGLGKRAFIDDRFYVSGHVGPLVGVTYLSYKDVSYNSKGDIITKTKGKIDFVYGAMTEIKAGFMVGDSWTITLGYCMSAPKFDFKNFVDGGIFAIGITCCNF